MTRRWPYRLFEATGLELEYMIVDSATLAVRPIADELIRAESGSYESEIELGDMAWSNELALHAIEIKTNGPAATLSGLAAKFQDQVRRMNGCLEPMGAMLMPTGMHPWMDPHKELRLWPHEYNPVYEAFNRIFDCRGHGWANLQSCHINLPFSDAVEFGRLHAAIRTILPLLPALAASSPVVDGRPTGLMDSRLEVYRNNAARVPSVTGAVIPEPIFSPEAYETGILERIYADLAPLDPEGTLRDEWVNARGCIARFDRGSIEIRVLDVQECPAADLAIAIAAIGAIEALACGRLGSYEDQTRLDTESLAGILSATIRDGDAAVVDDAAYLSTLGLPPGPRPASAVWRHLVGTRPRGAPVDPGVASALDVILEEGTLAKRISAALAEAPGGARLREVYVRLCRCLAEGEMFHAGA